MYCDTTSFVADQTDINTYVLHFAIVYCILCFYTILPFLSKMVQRKCIQDNIIGYSNYQHCIIVFILECSCQEALISSFLIACFE